MVSEGSILDQDAIDFSQDFNEALSNGRRSYIEAFEPAKSAFKVIATVKVPFLRHESPCVQDGPAFSLLAPVG